MSMRHKPLGSLTVITGSMFSGKTEELIRLVKLHQGDVFDEIDVEEVVGLLLRECALHCEEAVIERFGAGPGERRLDPFPILGALGANLDRWPAGQALRSVIMGRVDHEKRPRPLVAIGSSRRLSFIVGLDSSE